MFKDYYKTLDIPMDSSREEIKKAFKEQAKKWHPDKNPNRETTKEMQDVNEAYLILGDQYARIRYDIEYKRYQWQSSISHTKTKDKSHQGADQSRTFEYDDEVLKKWVQNARKQALEYVKQTLKEVGELSISATKTAGMKMLELFVAYSIFGILLTILMKACGAF